MTGCYLTDLPRQFIRGVADFEPDYPSNYFIPQETVKPARSLRQRATEAVEPNLAASGFLELLDKLRDVFLQDSVFVRRDHLDHPLFRDVLFTGPKYASFTTAVLAAADTLRHEDPHLVAIEKAIPSVNERLRSMTGVIQTGQAAHVVSLA
jgi:Centromere DNA-binding protein complex CBF3 subunit, domain 2